MAFYHFKKKKREREKCALEYMNKHCSIDFDHICLRVITLYKKIVSRWSLLSLGYIAFDFIIGFFIFLCGCRYSIDVERLSNNKSNKNNLLSV